MTNEKFAKLVERLQSRNREVFDLVWVRGSELGICDGFGGVEYTRCLDMWLKATAFHHMLETIRRLANATVADLAAWGVE